MAGEILLHIVPRFHPQTDGAGEYAFNLARALRECHGLQSQFIVCDPDRDGSARIDDFVVQRLRIRNEAGIWNLLSSAKQPLLAVMLHYCAYGYHKQGLPLWLHSGIKSWLTEHGGAKPGLNKQLITVFHTSLQAPLKPWNKEFCLRMPQKWLLYQFHRHSKLSIMSNRSLQVELDRIEPSKTMWSPIPGNSSDANAPRPDWKRIAHQYLQALQYNPSGSKAGNLANPVTKGQPQRPPAYA